MYVFIPPLTLCFFQCCLCISTRSGRMGTTAAPSGAPPAVAVAAAAATSGSSPSSSSSFIKRGRYSHSLNYTYNEGGANVGSSQESRGASSSSINNNNNAFTTSSPPPPFITVSIQSETRPPPPPIISVTPSEIKKNDENVFHLDDNICLPVDPKDCCYTSSRVSQVKVHNTLIPNLNPNAAAASSSSSTFPLIEAFECESTSVLGPALKSLGKEEHEEEGTTELLDLTFSNGSVLYTKSVIRKNESLYPGDNVPEPKKRDGVAASSCSISSSISSSRTTSPKVCVTDASTSVVCHRRNDNNNNSGTTTTTTTSSSTSTTATAVVGGSGKPRRSKKKELSPARYSVSAKSKPVKKRDRHSGSNSSEAAAAAKKEEAGKGGAAAESRNGGGGGGGSVVVTRSGQKLPKCKNSMYAIPPPNYFFDPSKSREKLV